MPPYDQADPADEHSEGVAERILDCTREHDDEAPLTWREREPERIRAWRVLTFEQGGCDTALAGSLADGPVDVADFRALVARGCPGSVAAEILR